MLHCVFNFQQPATPEASMAAADIPARNPTPPQTLPSDINTAASSATTGAGAATPKKAEPALTTASRAIVATHTSLPANSTGPLSGASQAEVSEVSSAMSNSPAMAAKTSAAKKAVIAPNGRSDLFKYQGLICFDFSR